jgi:hypothetical protein
MTERVTERMIDHLDESGAPCARHPAPTTSSLLQLAMVGSRAPAFHHDCASKLQGLVMALDELTELTENGDPQLLRAIENALDASRELNALLNTNRALTKPAPRLAIALRELMTRAAQRVGVTLKGELPDVVVNVTVPAMTHALALALDVAAGGGRGRSIAVSGGTIEGGVEIALATVAPAPSNASESLAIATFVLGRDGGRLWCATAGDALRFQLPTG